MTKCFISYSHGDKEFVNSLASNLRSNGVDVTIDDWELFAGDKIFLKIQEELIEKNDIILAVISQNSLNSAWVRDELNTTNIARIQKKLRLIPLVIDNSELPMWLQSIRYVKWDYSKNKEQNENRHLPSNILFSPCRAIGEKVGFNHLSPILLIAVPRQIAAWGVICFMYAMSNWLSFI